METKAMEEVKRMIITQLPELMKVDPDIRNFILNVTRESYPDKKETESRFDRIMDELKRDREARDKKWETQDKKWEAQDKKWEAQDKKWEAQDKKWETQDKKWEENQRVINEMLIAIQKLDKKHDATIGALGARWGLHSESAFRKGLRAILEDSFGVKVERYEDYDREGTVFGRPEQVELDVIIHNGTLILCEIKSSMSKSDMYSFWRKKDFYEKKHDRKAGRVIVISPMIDDYARSAAKDLDIEVYGYADNVEV